MSLFGVYYEFEVNRNTIGFLVSDIGITQKYENAEKSIAELLNELVNRTGSVYAKVQVHDKPGLMLRFSKHLWAERLPHPIEGAHAFIHGSSEGYLQLEEFKTGFETSLSSHGIQYTKYE
jgi:hypothetical protein